MRKKAREAFPIMAEWMQLPEPGKFTYRRVCRAPQWFNRNRTQYCPGAMRSFSMYKSSMSGNPLNATPYFNDLCQPKYIF